MYYFNRTKEKNRNSVTASNKFIIQYTHFEFPFPMACFPVRTYMKTNVTMQFIAIHYSHVFACVWMYLHVMCVF